MMFINLQHIFVSIDGVGEGSEDKFRRGRNRNGLGFHLIIKYLCAALIYVI